MASKVLMILTLWTFIISLGINISELYVYTNSLCHDKGTLSPWVALNFTALIIVKLYWLKTINETVRAGPRKSSSLVPFSVSGCFILLQFPQMTYDYDSCTQRNAIFSRVYVLNFSAALGVTCLSLFFWRVIKLTCYLCECELLSRKYPKLRVFKHGFYGILVLVTHSQAALLGLTQTNLWVANLFIENTLYVITAAITISFVLAGRKTKTTEGKIEVFIV